MHNPLATTLPTEGWPGWVDLGGWLHTECNRVTDWRHVQHASLC